MSKYRNLLISSENLSWAWRKARRLYTAADGPHDAAEIAGFELDLENQLKSIAKDFANGRYKMSPMVLLPQPKKPGDDGRSRMRQSFHISVRDQVAWIALVNVIGPTLDSKMPPWSYGHRLYKAAWYEEDDGRSHLALGPYRHSSGSLYRRFKHSWPLFRRHLSLTARVMTHGLGNLEQLDSSEKSAFTYSERPRYLDISHWPSNTGSELFYASIDLEKFYPKVLISAIQRSLRRYLDGYREDEWLTGLVTSMLQFRVTASRSVLIGSRTSEPTTPAGRFGGIPTNLMVAGFLSNVAMLPVDRIFERKLVKNNRIAHFRFVDDHAFLAYDFVELCEWIEQYKASIQRLKIGPNVSAEKYDPPELGKVIEGELTETAALAIKAQSRIDGSNPSKLMTKTLALVSELAGADFDILAEQSRELKLRELEWLLIADISEREIKTDTRAAFAAGRIAKLVPIMFTPSIDVLQHSRELARLEAEKTPDRIKISERRRAVYQAQSIEVKRYRNRIDHYFKLMFQAFRNHIDKPRLMVRVLDYCRTTGQSGTSIVLNYLIDLPESKAPIAGYLKSLAVQTISRHIVTATFEMTDRRLLFRRRRAARRYLDTLMRTSGRTALKGCIEAKGEDFASVSARNMLMAASSCAASMVASQSINKRFSIFSAEIEAPTLLSSSSQLWIERTGSPLGVWAHWLDGLVKSDGPGPGRAWRLTRTLHDPENAFDWNSLRKGPTKLPRKASVFLAENQQELLDASDAGWLLEQRESIRPISLGTVPSKSKAVRQLRRHLEEFEAQPNFASLLEWTALLKSLSPYDPRVGEWSALEIVRQLATSVESFGTGTIAILDQLHPSNVVLPRAWMTSGPPADSAYQHWTWESWKQVAKRGPVTVVKHKIQDYRRNPHGWGSADQDQLWRNRLRGVGLLLIGLCRRDFELPASWNVRGMERDITSLIKSQLEDATISSHTQAIIEAAVLPRSTETSLMIRNFWAFFGARAVTEINDTATDPPEISDIRDLIKQIEISQSILRDNQISVLNHAARQLVPMNAVQLTRVAAEPIQEDEDL